MTTEEFEQELKRVQQNLGLSDEQILTALSIHRKLLSGELAAEELMSQLFDSE